MLLALQERTNGQMQIFLHMKSLLDFWNLYMIRIFSPEILKKKITAYYYYNYDL